MGEASNFGGKIYWPRRFQQWLNLTLVDSKQCIMAADHDWTALDKHASDNGHELTRQLAVVTTCSNQPEKDELYEKDNLLQVSL